MREDGEAAFRLALRNDKLKSQQGLSEGLEKPKPEISIVVGGTVAVITRVCMGERVGVEGMSQGTGPNQIRDPASGGVTESCQRLRKRSEGMEGGS